MSTTNIIIPTCKITICGDGCVGKTCVFLSYTQNTNSDQYVPTVFDVQQTMTMHNNNPVSLVLCDSAGQEDYDELRKLIYPQTDVFLLCYAVNQPSSFSNISSKWIHELRREQPGVPIILVGTKTDIRQDLVTIQQLKARNIDLVTTQQGQELADSLGCEGFLECSALTQAGLKQVFTGALTQWDIYRKRRQKEHRDKMNKCCTIM